jgi:hypothetical protein
MQAVVSKKLGINLSSRKEAESFKWFLACLLFGKPIQQEIAERAYTWLVSAGLRSPDKVLDAGWDELVRLLDEAHYARYDFSTATKLLEVCQELKRRYGNMTKMIEQARSGSELSTHLQEFKHIGPVTARIFTQEIAPIWYGSRRSIRRLRRHPVTAQEIECAWGTTISQKRLEPSISMMFGMRPRPAARLVKPLLSTVAARKPSLQTITPLPVDL